jgi:2'-5' RNA ligase
MARLRTFIALDLGKAIRDRLVTLQESLARAAPDVKWVETENLHVTLLFLGEVDERDVLEVCRAVTYCCATLTPFSLSVEGVGCFGNPRRPRTIWIGVDEGAAEVKSLHAALEKVLLELGCYRREDRQYTPHITLGRVRQESAGADLAPALAKKADWNAGSVAIQEVLVISSELTPKGPIYSVLSRAPLGAPVS